MKRAVPLTAAQRMALDDRRNIAVTASAGSGKTATLVERYIELLRLHPEISARQILAITFTQKAAAEMRERLARRLAEALSQDLADADRRRLRQIYEDLPTARISTIHAFCTSVLREYPIEADVDPAFAILEEVDADALRRQAVRQTLETLANRADEDPDKEALRRTLGEWPRRYLDNILAGLLRKKRLARQWCHRYAELSPQAICKHWRQMRDAACRPICDALLANADFAAMLGELATLMPAGGEEDSAEKRLAPIRAAMRDLAADPTAENAIDIAPALAQNLLTARGQPLSARSLGKKSNWGEPTLVRMRELVPALGRLLAPCAELLGLALNEADTRAAQVLAALSRVFLQVDARFAQLKGEGGRLELDDLLERCHRLIAADAEVRAKLARHYPFALIDEFQDTDPLQWEIVRPLVSQDGEIAADKLFIVGDPKQSIYSFREADVTVFAEVRAAINRANAHHRRDEPPFVGDDGQPLQSTPEERLGSLVMGENFRTLAQPVAFVNALFARFMHPVPGEPFQVGYDPLVGRRPADDSPGSVELLLLPPEEDRDELDAVQREAELLARRIGHILTGDDLQVADKDGLRPPRPGDIAMLLRRRRNLFAYEYALRAHGIPFQFVGGRGFYQRQEIYDLANVLRVLHNPRDAVALLGALRSPYLGLSDNALYALTAPHGAPLWDNLHDPVRRTQLATPDREAADDTVTLLARWGRLRDRVPLIELLHAILEDTGAWGFLGFGERGGQNAANIRKLLDLAREQGGTLADFVARIDLLTAADDQEGEAGLDADADAVHVLTIHAAKGLEFPIVAVPDLAGEFNLRNSDAATIDADCGIGLRIADPEQGYRPAPSFVRRLTSHNERRRRLAEEKRLFYVACTRARDHLLLCGTLNADHFANQDLDAAKDCLFWVCRGLGLQAADLERGSKEVEGMDLPVRIISDPDHLPAGAHRPHGDASPAFAALLEAPGTLPADNYFDYLQPLDDPNHLPEFAVGELVLFAADPEAHYRQYALGLPPWALATVDDPRRRALLFGEIAHAGVEALSRWPDADPELLAADVLATRTLPVAAWREPVARELAALLDRCRRSPLASCWLHDAEGRTEEPFALVLDHGIVNGIIDYMGRGEDGLWQLVDYKTGQGATLDRYRLQLELYALYLESLFPGQPEYRAVLYLVDRDQTEVLHLDSQALATVRERANDLLAQLVRARQRP